MRSTRRLTTAGTLITVAGVVLFVWLVWWVGPAEIWAGFRQIGWGLLLIIALAGLRFALRASAWIRCLEPPHTLSLPTAFAAVVSGDALGNLTPLGPIVGEPAKAAFVRPRVPLGAGLTALAIENVLYTLSVAAMIAAGTVALLLHANLDEPVREAGQLAIAGVFGLYVAVVWILWRRPAVLSHALGALARRASSARLGARIAKVQALERDIYTFASRRRAALAPLVATELGFHALGVLEVHVTLWLLFDAPPPLLTSFILETVNRLINVVFKVVPLQVGVNEAGSALMTQILGLGTAPGLTLGIVRKARMLFWMLLGTALLVRHGLSARRILEDADLAGRNLHQTSTPAMGTPTDSSGR